MATTAFIPKIWDARILEISTRLLFMQTFVIVIMRAKLPRQAIPYTLTS